MWRDHGVARVNVQDQIAALAAKSPAELAADFTATFGHAPRRRHPDYMRKRLAHRWQEVAYGGLSRTARAALDRLVAEIQLPAPNDAPPPDTNRGPRPGSVLQREWRGKTVRVLVTTDGAFEWDGRRFGSLSAVAFAVTGAKWSGALFFGLRGMSSKS